MVRGEGANDIVEISRCKMDYGSDNGNNDDTCVIECVHVNT